MQGCKGAGEASAPLRFPDSRATGVAEEQGGLGTPSGDRGYRVHTSRITPLNLPEDRGEIKKSSSLPLERGGLGWGKT
ncbi:hypothetical protein NIES4103_69470 (plasmid) [Nostoc sp. NIES-4103]|nr:hypothetical protein NIES4103_69470 [Nostoc sp. NIES-4103]